MKNVPHSLKNLTLVFSQQRLGYALLFVCLASSMSCTKPEMERRDVFMERQDIFEEPTRLEIQWNEVLVLGADESQPKEYLFGQIGAIATDSDQNIYVADRQAWGIKVYDSSGRYLHTIGHRGQGPGEFQRITSLYIDKNDHLLVLAVCRRSPL